MATTGSPHQPIFFALKVLALWCSQFNYLEITDTLNTSSTQQPASAPHERRGFALPSWAGFKLWVALTAVLLCAIAGLAAWQEFEHRQLLIDRLEDYGRLHPEHQAAVGVLVSCNRTLLSSDEACGKALYASQGDATLDILAQMGAEGVFR